MCIMIMMKLILMYISFNLFDKIILSTSENNAESYLLFKLTIKIMDYFIFPLLSGLSFIAYP